MLICAFPCFAAGKVLWSFQLEPHCSSLSFWAVEVVLAECVCGEIKIAVSFAILPISFHIIIVVHVWQFVLAVIVCSCYSLKCFFILFPPHCRSLLFIYILNVNGCQNFEYQSVPLHQKYVRRTAFCKHVRARMLQSSVMCAQATQSDPSCGCLCFQTHMDVHRAQLPSLSDAIAQNR